MSLNFHSAVRFPPDVMVSQLGGESVLLNLGTESYFGLDDVGTDMWQALKQSGSIQRAFEKLAAEYDVDGTTLKHDLLEFVGALLSHGLIEITDGEAR